MPSPTSRPISFKAPGVPWGGMTTQSRVSPGQFLLLENCYVSSDGKEIRTFPGYVCVIDPETQQRNVDAPDTLVGYRKSSFDAQRPPWENAGSTYKKHKLTPTEQMVVWTEPTTIHFAEQMGGLWRFVGESDFRREPIFDLATGTVSVGVASVEDDGVNITITLDVAAKQTANTFNHVYADVGPPVVVCRIWLSGITGALASTLNDKGHVVVGIPSTTTLTLATTTGGAVGNYSTTGVIAKVTDTDNTNTPISDDVESLTVWTCLSKGDPTSSTPVEQVHAAYVANRMRDFGDAAGNILPGCTTATVNYPRSRRRQKSLPYRLVPHVAGNRIIMAAPGYGCVFQVPAIIPIDYGTTDPIYGIPSYANDVFDRPRALGIPKAIVWEDPDKTVGVSYHIYETGTDASLGWGGVAGAARAGRYRFKFAYQDDGTGEIGLCSETIEVTTDGTGAPGDYQYLRFLVYFPGYLLHECLALTVNVYRTTKGGEEFYFDRSIRIKSAGSSNAHSAKYGLDPVDSGNGYWLHFRYDAIYQSDAKLILQQGAVPDTIEQMPMGCKAARTIRGWTLFGGALGNAGVDQNLQLGTLSMYFDRNGGTNDFGYNYDEVMSAWIDSYVPLVVQNIYEGDEVGFGCAGHSIPPAYQGQYITSKTLFPFPRTRALLDLLVNTNVGWAAAFATNNLGRFPDVRYRIVDTPLQENANYTDSISQSQDTYLELPQGQLQISEPDYPNITPSTNTTTVTNTLTHDIEGIGDAGGHIVAASKSRTYFIGFSQSPVGATPETASDKFGCIAANSMVSFDSSCAWISDRGPVAMMGGFRWIGEPLQKLFFGESKRYLFDSKGMMRHSWACHDSERGLLYFGVFANRAATEDASLTVSVSYRGSTYTWADADMEDDDVGDQIKSRFPCDEVLVYSYKVDAWSVWRPPLAVAIQWMTEGIDDNGVRRVFFLGNDRRLYAMDDSFGLFVRDITQVTPPETGTAVTTVTVPDTLANRVGVPVLVCYQPKPGEFRVKYQRTVAAVGSGTIDLDSEVALTGAEWLIIGGKTMKVHTPFTPAKGSDAGKVTALGARCDLWSTFAASGSGTPQSAYFKGSVVTTHMLSNIRTSKEDDFTKTSNEPYKFVGYSFQDGAVFDVRDTGASSGFSFQAKLEFVGSAQVRLQDFYAEVD